MHVATDLTTDQLRAYRIADNKLSELADWDFDRLSKELAELHLASFDMSLLAFSQDEFTKILGDGATTACAIRMMCRHRLMQRLLPQVIADYPGTTVYSVATAASPRRPRSFGRWRYHHWSTQTRPTT